MKIQIAITALSLAAAAMSGVPAMAQTQTDGAAIDRDVLVIDPLFEYPLAPDSILTLQDRSDWLLEHFWDSMNFKEKTTVDQNALNDAFRVFVTPLRFGSADVALASTDRLVTQIAKNPTLSLQFAKAAEEALYGPRAEIWNDGIYLKFVDNLMANKQVKKERKARYERHQKLLKATQHGTVPPEFDYVMPDGKTAHYHPNGVITVIEFGDPDCDDCRFAKLKMDTDVTFSGLVDRGRINVLFVAVDPEEGWEQKLEGYPEKWHVGASESVGDLYDIRTSPTIYVIDREGKVAAKNIDVTSAMRIASAAAQY